MSGHDVLGLGVMPGGAEREPDCVAAIHEEDGTGRWLYPATAPLFPVWRVADRAVYAIEMRPPDARLIAIDTATGDTRCRSGWFTGTPADLVVTDAAAFLRTTDHHLYAVDPGDGRVLWDRPGITRSPTVANGRVFLVENARRLAVVEPASGEDRWPGKPGKGVLLAGPFVTDRTVCTVGHDGLTARNAETGRVIARHAMSLNPDCRGVPALVDGVLYFTNGRREVEAVALG
ncbi:PQQ-binding-like beta-propeller repeat protein [Kitasatospora sp. NPDC001527]|uniref:outer membrane protein assembly factor BamB family protein n=1 Tax=Kitasatospora sp. NPDC001527 TaxID=3154519 RepID=UPI00332BCC2C